MYISTFTTLQTALSGVEAAQEQLSTTGENISNEDTTDYEEQSVDLVENNPLDVAAGGAGTGYQIGTGVNAEGINNASDPYIDSAWRQVNSNSSSATNTESYLGQIQTLIGEPSTSGISSQMATFWSDWNELADDPTSTSAKQAVIDDGNQLASSFNSVSDELTGTDDSSVLSQAQTQYSSLLAGPTGSGESGGQVYNDAYDIASLNKSIVQATAAGENPNTLIDQRNAAIDDLSGVGNVSVTDNQDGSVSVYFGGVTSTALVADPVGTGAGTDDPGNNFSGSWSTAFANQFATADAAAAAAATASGDTQSASALASSVGGTLGSLIGLTGFSATGIASASNAATSVGTIGTVEASLDGVVSALVNEVNNPAVEGGTAGQTTALSTDFFNATGTTASTIAVNPALLADATQLQVSTSGNAGDNDIALDEAANSGGVADSAFGAFVEQVGGLVSDAQDAETTTSALSTQVTDQRDSVEGVDLSQEMENLIQEQQAYQASARVMSAFGTVMDSLLSAVSS